MRLWRGQKAFVLPTFLLLLRGREGHVLLLPLLCLS